MLPWGQQSANSIFPPSVPHVYLMTLSGALLPFIHAWKSCPFHHVQHAFCFVRHRGPVFHMLEGSERVTNWVCTFLSLASYSSPILCKFSCFPLFLDFTLPVFPFSWALPHLLNTCICHNLFWALILINSCVSVGILYYFFTYTACFTWICCYPVSWITSPLTGLP